MPSIPARSLARRASRSAGSVESSRSTVNRTRYFLTEFDGSHRLQHAVAVDGFCYLPCVGFTHENTLPRPRTSHTCPARTFRGRQLSLASTTPAGTLQLSTPTRLTHCIMDTEILRRSDSRRNQRPPTSQPDDGALRGLRECQDGNRGTAEIFLAAPRAVSKSRRSVRLMRSRRVVIAAARPRIPIR